MKKTLVVVCAVLIGLSAVKAKAQTPYLQLYFDDFWTQTTATCPTDPPGTVYATAYVVGHNWNMWVRGIEYKIVYPTQVQWQADIIGPKQLMIGTSQNGIAITWTPYPVSAFEAFLVQEVLILWMCDACTTVDVYWPIINYWTTDPANRVVTAVGSDLAEVSGVGLTAIICPNVPVAESTWGSIKSLYRD
jgi:hypothetical protein